MPHNQRRITAKEIEKIAVEAFDKSKRWITFENVRNEFGVSKQKSQRKLKIYCGTVIFAPGNYKPQRYYPTKLKAKVMEHLLGKTNVPIDPTGVTPLSNSFSSKFPLSKCLESVIIESLEGYVLPFLQSIPPHIHNMHFKTKISPECYSEYYIQELQDVKGNKGRQLFEIIGKSQVTYTFYPNGTVNVEVKCSNNPFKLETEIDHAQIFVFFGQLRSRLIIFLNDRHERIVPDIMEWYLMECEINRDVKVSDWLNYTGINIKVKHLNHLFQIYIKAIGQDTVCRVDERKHPNRPAIEAINEVLNPYEKIEKMFHQIMEKLDSAGGQT